MGSNPTLSAIAEAWDPAPSVSLKWGGNRGRGMSLWAVQARTTGEHHTDEARRAGLDVVASYDMITVPQAAKRVGRDPETIRRWIRAGKLRAQKVGTQHIVDESDLDEVAGGVRSLSLPRAWQDTWTGETPPDWVRVLHRSRRDH